MLCGTSFVLTDENCVYLHTLKKCVEELVVEDNWDAMYDRYTLAIKG